MNYSVQFIGKVEDFQSSRLDELGYGLETLKNTYLCKRNPDGSLVVLHPLQINRRKNCLNDLRFDLLKDEDQFIAQSLRYLQGQTIDLGTDILPAFFLKSHNNQLSKVRYAEKNQPAKEKVSTSVFLSFYDNKTPEQPVNLLTPQIQNSTLFQTLRQCFRRRPVWLKNSLLFQIQQIKFKHTQFKRCLNYLAYSFRDGPWKHTYVRFGFDPRKDEKSVVFQSFSLNLKQVDELAMTKHNQVYDPTFKIIPNLIRATYQFCDIQSQSFRKDLKCQLSQPVRQCDRKFGFMRKRSYKQMIKSLKL